MGAKPDSESGKRPGEPSTREPESDSGSGLAASILGQSGTGITSESSGRPTQRHAPLVIAGAMIQGEQEDLPNPVLSPPTVNYSIFTNEIPAAEQVHIRCPPSPGMLLVFGAKLFGKEVKILIDSGASGNFIDLNFCRSRGYRTTRMERPREVKIANSSSLSVDEIIPKAVFSYEGFKDLVFFKKKYASDV